MLLRIIGSTDRQHLGLNLDIDLDNPPESIDLTNGDTLKVMSIRDIGGMYQIASFNYIIEAVPV
jgi:hypothetical protein